MLKRIKKHLRELENDGPPGKRFKLRYAKEHRVGNKRNSAGRILRMLGALVAVAIGVVLSVMPGPAVVFFLIAGALLAKESLLVARLLDSGEVKGRRVLHWLKQRWTPLSPALKGALVSLGCLMSVAMAYVSFRIMRG